MLPPRFLRSSHFVVFPRLILLVLGVSGLIVPGAGARPGRPRNIKEQTYKQTYHEVQSVDAAAHTVTIATMEKEVVVNNGANTARTHQGKSKKDSAPVTKSTATYAVNTMTEIEINGQKGDLGSLQKGMKVDVTKGMDETTAARLVVTP